MEHGPLHSNAWLITCTGRSLPDFRQKRFQKPQNSRLLAGPFCLWPQAGTIVYSTTDSSKTTKPESIAAREMVE